MDLNTVPNTEDVLYVLHKKHWITSDFPPGLARNLTERMRDELAWLLARCLVRDAEAARLCADLVKELTPDKGPDTQGP